MKKKIVFGILMLFACFALTGCGCSKKEYSVKFDSRGGSSVSSQTVADGDLVIKPADPTRSGYSFAGWFLDLDDDDAFDFNSKISKDITLYAKWNQGGASVGGECNKTCDDGYTLDSKTCECVKNNDDSDKNVAVSSVKLNKNTTTLTVGASETLKLTISPSNASNKSASWKSSDTSVVTVKNGKITAVGVGTATVTVTVDGKSTSITVTVKEPVKVDSVSISGDKTVKVGKTIKLTATVKPSDATDKTVSWKSSDNGIATVSSDGTVKGVKAGSVTITATAGGVSATYTITVEDDSEYTYTVTQISDPMGATLQSEIRVFKNGVEVTKDVERVWTADGVENLGKYSSNYKAILVKNTDVSRIGAIKIGSDVIKITKR